MFDTSVINIIVALGLLNATIVMMTFFEHTRPVMFIILIVIVCRLGLDGLILLETYDSHKELQQISDKYSEELVCKNGILGHVEAEQRKNLYKSIYSDQSGDIVAYKKLEINNKVYSLFYDDKDFYNVLYFVPVSTNGCKEYEVNKNINSLLKTITSRNSGYRILTY